MRFVRAFTIFLFCLSQLFAPLVHAHVGADLSPAALHLPGLETAVYQGVSDAVPFEDHGGLVVQAAKGVRSGPLAFPSGSALVPPIEIEPRPLPASRAPVPVTVLAPPFRCVHLPPSRAPPHRF